MFVEKVTNVVLASWCFAVSITRICSLVYIAKNIDPNNTFRDVTFNVSALRTCLSRCTLNQCYYVNYDNQTCDLFGRSLNAISTGNIALDGYRLQAAELDVSRPDKDTSHSSDFQIPWRISSMAVDGLSSTFSNTNLEANPWWMIDLGHGYFITYLQLDFPNPSYITSAKIYLSNSSVAPTPASFQQLPVFATYPGPAPASTVIINGTVPIMWGRFLVVQLSTTQYLQINEINIFAIENNWP